MRTEDLNAKDKNSPKWKSDQYGPRCSKKVKVKDLFAGRGQGAASLRSQLDESSSELSWNARLTMRLCRRHSHQRSRCDDGDGDDGVDDDDVDDDAGDDDH